MTDRLTLSIDSGDSYAVVDDDVVDDDRLHPANKTETRYESEC
jgi:hypothetical protein